MHTDIPALVAAQIGPLAEFADRFGQIRNGCKVAF